MHPRAPQPARAAGESPATAGAGARGASDSAAVRLERLVVAIDGPSGSGKSTVARRVAARLGVRYLDTGAMYRAITWRALEERIDVEDADAVVALAEQVVVTVGTNPRRPTIAVDGVDVSRPIRSRAVSNAVSAVAAVPGVRTRLVARQRELIGSGGIVVEGRDIGTVVAPDAAVKIFLTASSDARARRRHRQLATVGEGSAVDVTRREIDRRDARDTSRSTSPLAKATDAYEIDSTGMDVAAVVDAVLRQCRRPEASRRTSARPPHQPVADDRGDG